jgi:predicted nucleic acid-binding protein
MFECIAEILRYADMMIAAMVLAGNHIVVTRNIKHFEPLLPKNQIANWIDDKPS